MKKRSFLNKDWESLLLTDSYGLTPYPPIYDIWHMAPICDTYFNPGGNGEKKEAMINKNTNTNTNENE